MFVMYDSTDLSQIPAGPHAVGCYRNGRYANEHQARNRFPHSRILPISVTGLIACDCYDIETGDYQPANAPELVRLAISAGIWRPCLYANASSWPLVTEALSGAGLARELYRRWVAVWDEHAVLGPDEDAKQFTDRALGRRLDESICSSTFFQPLTPDRRYAAEVELDADTGSWAIRGLPYNSPPLG